MADAHDTVLDYADLFSVTLHDDNIQEFDIKWVKDSILYRLRLCENSKLCWNCTTRRSEDVDAQLSKIEDSGEEECKC